MIMGHTNTEKIELSESIQFIAEENLLHTLSNLIILLERRQNIAIELVKTNNYHTKEGLDYFNQVNKNLEQFLNIKHLQ